MFLSVSEFYETDFENYPFVTDSGANIKCALKFQEWYPCFDHRLHTAIIRSWNSYIENDLEAQLLYKKMLNVRTFFKKSADKESKLPKKIPNDSPTRPWCGLSAFFSAFDQSFDKMCDFVPITEMPSNRILLNLLSKHLQEFTEIFKALECANKPSIHRVLLDYKKIMKNLKEWPDLLDFLRQTLKKSNFKK